MKLASDMFCGRSVKSAENAMIGAHSGLYDFLKTHQWKDEYGRTAYTILPVLSYGNGEWVATIVVVGPEEATP